MASSHRTFACLGRQLDGEQNLLARHIALDTPRLFLLRRRLGLVPVMPSRRLAFIGATPRQEDADHNRISKRVRMAGLPGVRRAHDEGGASRHPGLHHAAVDRGSQCLDPQGVYRTGDKLYYISTL